ncbi:hypothetical protein GCM10011344_15900 [Dokdonia pacifica]|uniref:DUF1330 domain-containing protein n=1 Tax=Dokdonia pacifica TaxID=1627892 RepID=A0A238VZV6_9FLAO|nr:DUF1330 domain-containing protein [Dokdonia pacifica]GGG16161.1 hypothetical protein GCM10011344_15900 [Dokdonia pacifica]SNR39796.1 protein of unknown function [Dokdonia pacifica]
MSRISYLDVTPEAGRNYFSNPPKGEIVMLNLLKFKDIANYSQTPALTPETPISGKEAYQLYMEHTLPFLKEAGSEVLFSGKSASFLIGPSQEDWDLVLLVKHKDAATFLKFAQNEAYLSIAGHRAAALEDSRLLPITPEH